ncbi:lysozyme [Stappia indica]|uniref:lysozyme n=1 Tax=Stappia indica TaxID=538381 RepID=UPI001CD1FD4B|nr:lysozyme [Stappia indica]MCA1297546.1 lysozyme [Stappia indica]
MRLSDRGAAFIARHEGLVTRAYRDPAGVVTIGYGFTERSAVFRAWWRERHRRPLAIGDRISRKDCEALLARLVEKEYGAAVLARFGAMPQHRFDACCSVAYNLGPGALNWRWARALAAGDVTGAARILAENYATAGGRRLAGLVRRRREEARLLLTGDYGDGTDVATSETQSTARPAGDAGERTKTAAPRRSFRRPLLRRPLLRRKGLVALLPAGAAALLAVGSNRSLWLAGAGLLAALLAGWLVWRLRGRLPDLFTSPFRKGPLMRGWKTLVLNGLAAGAALLLECLHYLAGVDWTSHLAPQSALWVVIALNLGNILLRHVTDGPAGWRRDGDGR